jgi:hypothetical protein
MQKQEIEAALSLLAQGEAAAAVTEANRQERYKLEDAARVELRAREDFLRDGGAAVRAARKAELQALQAQLVNTPQKQTDDRVALLNEKVTQLEAMVKAAASVAATPATPAA